MPRNIDKIIYQTKNNFNPIEKKFNNIKTMTEGISQSISKLSKLYESLLHNNKNNPTKIISLDSFRFQIKTLEFSLESNIKFSHLVSNRIYCDFYRLYQEINKYFREYIDKSYQRKYKPNLDITKYNYLDIFQGYEFEKIKDLVNENFSIIDYLNSYIKIQQNEYKNFKLKNKTGIDIQNILFTYEHTLQSIQEKILYFCKFIDFYYKLHIKYLIKTFENLNMLKSQITADFEFDESNFINDEDVTKEYNGLSASSKKSFFVPKLQTEEDSEETNSNITTNNNSSSNSTSDTPEGQVVVIDESNINENIGIESFSNKTPRVRIKPSPEYPEYHEEIEPDSPNENDSVEKPLMENNTKSVTEKSEDKPETENVTEKSEEKPQMEDNIKSVTEKSEEKPQMEDNIKSVTEKSEDKPETEKSPKSESSTTSKKGNKQKILMLKRK
jgi:hypothetical protein